MVKKRKVLPRHGSGGGRSANRFWLFVLIATAVPVFFTCAGMLIALFIYSFIVTPHRMDGHSMEPGFRHNDLIMVNRLDKQYHYQDVVVFEGQSGLFYIKRIIALPGDKVRIENGLVWINGNALDESHYLSEGAVTSGSKLINEEDITIPQGKVLVLGDNRSNSLDSRTFGFVDIDKIEGKVFLIWWPSEHWSRL